MAAQLSIKKTTGASPHIQMNGFLFTGKKNDSGSHRILIRNNTDKIRLLVKAKEGNDRIADYFVSPINTNADDEAEGYFELAAAPNNGHKDFILELNDAAWKGANDNEIKFAACSFDDEECDFGEEDDEHVDDIIVEGGN